MGVARPIAAFPAMRSCINGGGRSVWIVLVLVALSTQRAGSRQPSQPDTCNEHQCRGTLHSRINAWRESAGIAAAFDATDAKLPESATRAAGAIDAAWESAETMPDAGAMQAMQDTLVQEVAEKAEPLDLVIDEPEHDSHLFLQDPDLGGAIHTHIAVRFRVASAASGAGYGRGAGYCCRKQVMLRMSLTKDGVPVEHVWKGGPIRMCSNVAVGTMLDNAQNSADWGDGRNTFEMHVLDAWDMRLLARGRSSFDIHLTQTFDYGSLQGLAGQELFEAARPAFSGVLPRGRVFLPTSLQYGVRGGQLKVVTRDMGVSGSTQRRLTVYVLCNADPVAGGTDGRAGQWGYEAVEAVLSQVSLFEVTVRRVMTDVPLTRYRGRPRQDTDFAGEDAYRTDYVSFEKAWREYAGTSGGGEDEWAVFVREDVVVHESVRTGEGFGEWMGNVLQDVFALGEEDGLAYLGLCGHVLPTELAPDADVRLPHNVTTEYSVYGRGVGPFPLAVALTKRRARGQHWWTLAGRDVHRAGGMWIAGFSLGTASHSPRDHSGAASDCIGVLSGSASGGISLSSASISPPPMGLRKLDPSVVKVAYCLVGHPRHFNDPNRSIASRFRRNLIGSFAPDGDNFVFALPVISGMQSDVVAGCKQHNYRKYMRGVEGVDLNGALEDLRAVRVKYIKDECERSACTPRPMNCSHTSPGTAPTRWNLNQFTFQMSRWKDCVTMVEQYERENQMLFDWVWKIRLDLFFNYPVPHVSLLDSSRVYTANPRQKHGWALVDLFFAVPRKFLNVVFGSVDLVQCEYAEMVDECR